VRLFFILLFGILDFFAILRQYKQADPLATSVDLPGCKKAKINLEIKIILLTFVSETKRKRL